MVKALDLVADLAPAWKIKTVSNLPVAAWEASEPSKRAQMLAQCDYNLANRRRINGDLVYLNMMDGQSSAMSQEQLGALHCGDEAYAGSNDFYKLQQSIHDSLGYDDVVPVHSLTGASHIFNLISIQKGQTVITNSPSWTNLHIENHVVPKEHCVKNFGSVVVCHDGSDRQFTANMDVAALEAAIQRVGADKIAYVFMMASVEGCHGEQHFSVANLRAVKEVAARYNIPVMLNASRVPSNAFAVQQREAAFGDMTVAQIAKIICELTDGALISGLADFLTNTGAAVAFRRTPAIVSREWFRLTQGMVVEFEGLHTYGGMAGRDMGVFAMGIQEALEEGHSRHRAAQTRFFEQRLRELGVPLLDYEPVGCVHVNVDKLFEHLPKDCTRSFCLAAALFAASGVMAMPVVMACPKGGKFETMRLFVPPRAFTVNQLEYAAKAVAKVCSKRLDIPLLTETTVGEDLIALKKFTSANPVALETFAIRNMSTDEDTVEPYRIRSIEPVHEIGVEGRHEGAKRGGFNTFLIRMEDGVRIDLLTDSGTNAQSLEQWAALVKSAEGSGSSYMEVEKAVKEVYNFDKVIPTHQGRMAEFLLSQSLIKEGDVIPGNMYFTTTKFHQIFAGAHFYDVIVDDAEDTSSMNPFKGNFDLEKLEALIQKQIKETGSPHMPYMAVAGPVNMAGGHPISMENIRALRAIADKYTALYPNDPIRLIFDATRAVENCELVRQREEGWANVPLQKVLHEMCSYFEGATMSAKKDNLVNIGGWLAIRDCPTMEGVYDKMVHYSVMFDDHCGDTGLGQRNLACLSVGIREMMNQDYMRSRLSQVKRFGDWLLQEGVPIVLPVGGHGVFVDAIKFLTSEKGELIVPRTQYCAQALAAAIYEVSGVRAMERGAVSAGRDYDGNEIFPALELVRLTIPRRVYLDEQLRLVARQLGELYRNRESIKGLKMVYEPKALRFFQARFEQA